MPTTVEAVSPLGRKMEALHETRERHLEELNRLRARVVELVREEEQARDSAVTMAPGRRSDERGALAPVAKLIRDREETEKKIVNLERELEAVNRVAEQAAHGWRREQREAETKRARTTRAEERAAVEAFCGHFVALAEAWLALREVQVPRYVHTGAVRAGGLLNDMGPDESAAWDQAAAPVGGKVPENFMRAVQLAYTAATDDGCRIPSAQGGSPTAGSWPEFIAAMPELVHARTAVSDPFVEIVRSD